MAEGSRSSIAERAVPGWVRLMIPSVGDLIFIALLGLLVFTPLSTRLLGDAGIGWHIRTGQRILATHAIPRVDPFSATMMGKPWFAWEWLYDALVGGLERSGGLNGVVCLTAVTIALVFAGLLRWLVGRGTNLFVALALVLLAASASMIHFLVRPHVVSWLFTLVWLWILESSESDGKTLAEERHRQLLWFLPVLMLVWVNVHGGFLIGFVLLGIYWVGSTWRWFRLGDDRFEDLLLKLKARRRATDLGIVSVAAVVATLANPYGWKLHVHIYQYLSNRFLMDHIDEFQSPNFHGVAQRCFAALLLVTFVALAARGRDVRLREGLTVLFAVYSGLYASRNIPVSSVLLAMVIGPLLRQAFENLVERRGSPFGVSRYLTRQAAFSKRMGRIESSLQGHLWPVAAVIASCLIAANGGQLREWSLMDAHFDGKRFPVEAVTYLEKHETPRVVLAPDYWGGYVIYRLYPHRFAAGDDRHDLYGEQFLKSYLKMIHVEPGWDDFLREHRIHCVMVPLGSALSNILTETSDWKAIYMDGVAIVFVRSGEVSTLRLQNYSH